MLKKIDLFKLKNFQKYVKTNEINKKEPWIFKIWNCSRSISEDLRLKSNKLSSTLLISKTGGIPLDNKESLEWNKSKKECEIEKN